MSAPTIERPIVRSASAEDPRRRGWWIAARVLSVLLIIGIAGYAYLDHYQPLASGALGRSDTAYEDGAPFSYAYWLINQGSLPVTVTSVTPPDDSRHLIRVLGYFISRTNSADAAGDIAPRFYEPFRPFSLAPGEGRGILVRAEFRGCVDFSRGTGETFVQQFVAFRAYGVSRTAWIPMSGFAIMSPKDCPGRD